jgi:RND superfamily putative drug exporter
MLLVPATMELLGRKNWWMPKWLDRVLPRLTIEGSDHDDQQSIVGPSDASGAAPQPVIEREPVSV